MEPRRSSPWIVNTNPPSMQQQPPRTIKISADKSQDFEILSLLEEGSFGAVYKSLHKPSDAIVAVKVIQNGGSTEDEKIMGEIDILSRCDSPYIVGYFECFIRGSRSKHQSKVTNSLKVASNEMWIVTEYCSGGSMSDFLEA
jgi:serine/threonine protein kinase